MVRTHIVGAFVIVLVGATLASARADEHKLNFRLITHRIDMKVVEAPDAEGHVLGTGQYEGAKGTGWFKEVEEPWDGASLFDGGFELALP